MSMARPIPCLHPATEESASAISSVVSSASEDEPGQRHAELFYLQKQIQSQTPMVIVLADGEQIEGCIEWYDRKSLKVRGREQGADL